MLARDEVEQGVVDGLATGVGEDDAHAATVGRIRLPADEPAPLEAVDAVRHRAAGDEGLGAELTWGERVGRAGAAQGGEDVELPRLEGVAGEGLASGEVEVPGEPGHPGEDLQGGDVEVRALALPGRGDAVDLVCGRGACHAAMLRQDS